MHRVINTFRSLLYSLVVCGSFAAMTLAQTPSPSPSPAAPAAQNPFAPEKAPPLPAGMTGSNTEDPRFKLTPGLYNAGETSMGLKHLSLVKKPDAFQLGTDDPEDPKVQKTLGQLGFGDTSQMPKSIQIVLAQLAFGNSDLAFKGKHVFQG